MQENISSLWKLECHLGRFSLLSWWSLEGYNHSDRWFCEVRTDKPLDLDKCLGARADFYCDLKIRFIGEIVQITRDYQHATPYHYQIEIHSLLHRYSIQKKSRYFENSAAEKIIHTLLDVKDYQSLKILIKSDILSQPIIYFSQQDETDYECFERFCMEYGLIYRFNHQGGISQLIVEDETSDPPIHELAQFDKPGLKCDDTDSLYDVEQIWAALPETIRTTSFSLQHPLHCPHLHTTLFSVYNYGEWHQHGGCPDSLELQHQLMKVQFAWQSEVLIGKSHHCHLRIGDIVALKELNEDYLQSYRIIVLKQKTQVLPIFSYDNLIVAIPLMRAYKKCRVGTQRIDDALWAAYFPEFIPTTLLQPLNEAPSQLLNATTTHTHINQEGYYDILPKADSNNAIKALLMTPSHGMGIAMAYGAAFSLPNHVALRFIETHQGPLILGAVMQTTPLSLHLTTQARQHWIVDDKSSGSTIEWAQNASSQKIVFMSTPDISNVIWHTPHDVHHVGALKDIVLDARNIHITSHKYIGYYKNDVQIESSEKAMFHAKTDLNFLASDSFSIHSNCRIFFENNRFHLQSQCININCRSTFKIQSGKCIQFNAKNFNFEFSTWQCHASNAAVNCSSGQLQFSAKAVHINAPVIEFQVANLDPAIIALLNA